ncbi:MAG: ATP-binding protein [Fibrobacteria bacterium]|nr:ATP-binding protein [Fibrobacteria bacterium]
MIKRTVDNYLAQWVSKKKRKPLIIRGARQVGKTYSVDRLGESFEHYIKIDFEELPSYKKLFQKDLDVKKITTQICALHGIPFSPETTLLFFDEIQECPEAILALRYYYEKFPEICVIAAGSLLELNFTNLSFPVGRIEFYWMYPITFMEFLQAKNAGPLTSSIPDLSSTEPVPDLIHEKLLEDLKEYYIIGGMPEAVQTFLDESSFTSVAEVHRSILFSYIEDITKHYPRTDKDLVSRVLYSCAGNVGRQIKYAGLVKGERSDTIKAILEKLYKILLVHPVYAANGEHPFKVSCNQKLFKLIFLDIGLMQTACGVSFEESILEADLMAAYEGALAEQFAGQELTAGQTFAQPEIFYWTRQEQGGAAEIDFLMEHNPVVPVEVKSGKAGRLRSMHQALIQFKDAPFGVVLSTRNVEVLQEQRLKFLPLYSSLR